jgi:hypothetical protein
VLRANIQQLQSLFALFGNRIRKRTDDFQWANHSKEKGQVKASVSRYELSQF